MDLERGPHQTLSKNQYIINNLEIDNLFKDKNKKEGIGVTDFINRIV